MIQKIFILSIVHKYLNAYWRAYWYTQCYIVLLRMARNLLETRENIKVRSQPFYHIICDWFSWGSRKKILQKEIRFFKIANSQNLFVKISWIGPWISRIDWCKGHWCDSTYMAVRLSDISSKIGKKYIFCVFRPFLSLCRKAS